MYQFSGGEVADINSAVISARQAYDDGVWSSLSIHQRKSVLYNLAEMVDSHKEEFALYECLDVGKPITSALNDIAHVTACIKHNAEMADKLLSPSGADGSNFSYKLRKPIGVVGGIVGWNFPLVLAALKVAPALATGNSIVLKPSEYSSLSASRLAELAVQAGVPSGVFNVVHGRGDSVGAALALHSDVDMLTFTGSSLTGKKMMMAAGQSNMKRLMLECGGKSPYIIFDDCPSDLDFLAQDIVEAAFCNQGQNCMAGSRLLIQEGIKSRLVPKIIEYTKLLEPRDPFDPETVFGPLVGEAHLNKVLAYIESGKNEGARLIFGGQRLDIYKDASSRGCYLHPTIFDNVSSQQKIAKEEIFGPVLSVMSFKDEAQAISLANDSDFGLAAYIATENLSRSHRLAMKLNAGVINICGSSAVGSGSVELSKEPFKQSGFGLEGGMEGLASYTISSAVNMYL